MIRIECDSVAELRELVTESKTSSLENIELVNENNKLRDDLRLAQEAMSQEAMFCLTQGDLISFSRGLVNFLINHDEAELVRMFVRSQFPNDKINQIKLLKQTMGSGLKDTKEFIEGTINHL